MKAIRVTLLIAGILVAWLAFNTASWAQSLEPNIERDEFFEPKVRYHAEKPKPSFRVKPVKHEIKREVRNKVKHDKVKIKALHKKDIRVHVKARPQIRPVRINHASQW
jgi:hypothetical protein